MKPARAALNCMILLALALFAAGCGLPFGSSPALSRSATPPPPTSSPTATASPSPSASPSASPTPAGTLPVWGAFAAPSTKLVTAVPPPMPADALPQEVKAIILAGLDRPYPYPGRSDTLLLVLYHPRLAKAALISIPPDLFGYLPGQTMQRLYAAYPLGGGRLLQETIAYNTGIRPDFWLAAHTDDFSLLVDELGGLTVPVLETIPNLCDGIILQGDVEMDGPQALCYARLRLGIDEAARGLRQQQILRLVFDHLVQNGNLTQTAELFGLFHKRIDTNLTLNDALAAIPLALRLGDPSRTAYFQIGAQETTLWQFSDHPPASVFLPKPAAIAEVIRKAAAFVNQPSPQSDLVLTLEAQLTNVPGQQPAPTAALTDGPTLTATSSPARSATPSPTRPAPTASATATATNTVTPSPTPSPTVTFAP